LNIKESTFKVNLFSIDREE